MTGINFFNLELAGKTLELLRELVPAATRVAVIVNPATSMNAEFMLRDLEPATHGMGLKPGCPTPALAESCAASVSPGYSVGRPAAIDVNCTTGSMRNV